MQKHAGKQHEMSAFYFKLRLIITTAYRCCHDELANSVGYRLIVKYVNELNENEMQNKCLVNNKKQKQKLIDGQSLNIMKCWKYIQNKYKKFAQ